MVVEVMVVMPRSTLPRTPTWVQEQSPFFSVISFQGRGAVSREAPVSPFAQARLGVYPLLGSSEKWVKLEADKGFL